MTGEEAKRRLNILPENPDREGGRFPKWLHRKLPSGNALWKTKKILKSLALPTVCEEANCPNILECFSKKTATFLAMGKECTRNCGFCDIDFSKQPKPLEADEPIRLSQSVKDLGLKHVVITMVARDDLVDGGSSHLAQIVQTVRRENPEVTIEVLTSDFEGNLQSLLNVVESAPEIINHNIETVRELTPRVRHKATYERTLSFLTRAKVHGKGCFVKSGLMVGLGETKKQVEETIVDLFNTGCDILTIGHYLQANKKKLLVKEFIPPEQFADYANYAKSIGFKHVYAAPFVRSSYNAEGLFNQLKSSAFNE